jgi:hypothetical protein
MNSVGERSSQISLAPSSTARSIDAASTSMVARSISPATVRTVRRPTV